MITAGEFDFSSYITERTRDFTGRGWILTELDRWLADKTSPRFFILTGEPGVGKTALAAHLIRSRPELIGGYHFCSARRGGWIDPVAFSRSLALQFSHRYSGFRESLLRHEGVQIDAHQAIGVMTGGQAVNVLIENIQVVGEEATFNRLVRAPLKDVPAADATGQLIVVVDGLDEALAYNGATTIVDLLSRADDLPPFVRMVLTSRDERRVLRYWDHVPHFRIHAGGESNLEDVRAYVTLRLDRVMQTSSKTIEDIVHKSAGNFLYVVHLLDTIERQPELLEQLDTFPEGVDGVYRMFLNSRDVGRDFGRWESHFLHPLGILAVAREPMDENQLAELTGMDGQRVAMVLRDLWQYLSIEDSQPQRYRIYHQSFVDFLLDKQRSQDHWLDARNWHGQIAACYFRSLPKESGPHSLPAPYALRHLSHHLFAAGMSESLFGLVESPFWCHCQYERDPTGSAYATDLDLALRFASQSGGRGLAKLVGYAVTRASVVEPFADISPDLLAELVLVGRGDEAWNLAASIMNTKKGAAAFARIGAALWKREDSGRARDAWRRARELAVSVGQPAASAEAYLALLEALANSRQNDELRQVEKEVERSIQRIPDVRDRVAKRAEVLNALAPIDHSNWARDLIDSSVLEIESIEHRPYHYGGSDHEDPPYDSCTGVWEKCWCAQDIGSALLRFRDQEWSTEYLTRLESTIRCAEQIEANMRMENPRYRLFRSAGEEVKRALSSLSEVRKHGSGIPLRGLISRWEVSRIIGIIECISEKRFGEVSVTYLGNDDVESIVQSLVRGGALNEVINWGYLLAKQEPPRLDCLARMALAFARNGIKDVAAGLAEVIERAAAVDPAKCDLSTLLDCAIAMDLVQNRALASRLKARADVVSQAQQGKQDNLLRIARAWRELGDHPRASDLLTQALPAHQLAIKTARRDEALAKLKIPNTEAIPVPQPGSAALWDVPSLAKSALRYTRQATEVCDVLKTMEISALPSERLAQRDRLKKALEAQPKDQWEALAGTLRVLLALNEYETTLEWAGRFSKNDLRADLLMAIALRVTEEANPVVAAKVLDRLLGLTKDFWAKEEISRVLGAVALAYAALGDAVKAWETVQLIEYNDLRADAVSAMLLRWREQGRKEMIRQNAASAQTFLDGIWARVEAVRGMVVLAASLVWVSDRSGAESTLRRAFAAVEQLDRPQREERPSFFTVPTIERRGRWEHRYVEENLGALAGSGFADEAILLAIKLGAAIHLPAALNSIGATALAQGDTRIYQRVLLLRSELGRDSAYSIPHPSQTASLEFRVAWVTAAFLAASVSGQDEVWNHLREFGPTLSQLDESLPKCILDQIERLETAVQMASGKPKSHA
jgi:DNA polymerase III delta prime subunit